MKEKIVKLLNVLLQSVRANWDETIKEFVLEKILETDHQKAVRLLEHLVLTQKTAMTVAELLEKFGFKENNYPSVDEAFKIALETQDEAKSVIVCDEIMQAWGVACRYFAEGLKLDGKKAFENEYKKLVEKAQVEGRQPRWWISYGASKELRAIAEKEAIKMGLLKSEQAIHLQIENNKANLQLEFLQRVEHDC